MNGNARARRHRRASSSSPTHRGRARAHARAEHRARTRGDHPRRTIRRVNLSRIHPSIGRSVGRSVDRARARARHRAIVSPITTRREGGTRRRRPKGGVAIGPDSSRCGGVSTRLIFIPTPAGRPSAERIHTHTRIEPIYRYVRSRSDRSRAIFPRRLGRFFAGTSSSSHGGAREDDGRRRETTGDDDGRRETGDERRETRDGRRETRDARRARRRRPSRRLDEGGRGTRREDGVGACAFSTRVWARGRDSFAGHHSSWVTIRTDSRNRDESRRRRREGGRDLCRAVSGVF